MDRAIETLPGWCKAARAILMEIVRTTTDEQQAYAAFAAVGLLEAVELDDLPLPRISRPLGHRDRVLVVWDLTGRRRLGKGYPPVKTECHAWFHASGRLTVRMVIANRSVSGGDEIPDARGRVDCLRRSLTVDAGPAWDPAWDLPPFAPPAEPDVDNPDDLG